LFIKRKQSFQIEKPSFILRIPPALNFTSRVFGVTNLQISDSDGCSPFESERESQIKNKKLEDLEKWGFLDWLIRVMFSESYLEKQKEIGACHFLCSMPTGKYSIKLASSQVFSGCLSTLLLPFLP